MMPNRDGFTLTGTTVAAALLGVVFLVALGTFVAGQRSGSRGSGEADLQQEALIFAYRLTREVAEAREVLLPLQPGRGYPFLAFRSFDQEIVLYAFLPGRREISRQVIDPSTWGPSEEKVVCRDVASALWSVSRLGQFVHSSVKLEKEVGGRLLDLPIETGVAVQPW